jgi:2-oxoisovalerate dehydrogenase E2 component (dihydrolipoyl transacylase)
MAAVDVPLPELGKDAGDEARVSFWYVDVGDKIAEGADLVQMLTDKATFDVPSPVAGKIARLLAAEEQTVKVGQPLCQIEVGGQ